MSTRIEVNGTQYLSTREAAKLVSMSHDYVSRLARERRVVGVQIGRKWYVDPVSLKNFKRCLDLEKESRRQQLRAERIAEQRIARASSFLEERKSPLLTRGQWVPSTLQAIVMLLLGGFVGVAGYLASTLTNSSSVASFVSMSLQQLAQVSSEHPPTSLNGLSATHEVRAVEMSESLVRPEFSSSNETAFTQRRVESPYVLIGTAQYEDYENYVASLFSDPVEIEWVDHARGKITPILTSNVEAPIEIHLIPNETSVRIPNEQFE